jgi:fatty-acyl-CoA synthase
VADKDNQDGLEEDEIIRDILHEGPTMADLIARALARFPEHTAMEDHTGPITYRNLSGRINRVARVLESHGVRRGDGVAQLATNSIDAWVVQAATYFLGARFIGLHGRGGIDDQVFMLADSGAATLVVDARAHPGRAAELARRVRTIDVVLAHGAEAGAVDLWSDASAVPGDRYHPHARWNDMARLAYTGGTTGRPKGVMLPHRSLVMNTLMTMAELEWPREIRIVLPAPITHGAGSYVLPVLLRGGTVRLFDHFAPDAFLDAIEQERATCAMLVPTMLYSLLDHPRTRQADLSSLQLISYGASPVSPDRLAEAIEIFGHIFQQGYGQTESPNTIAALFPSEHDGERLSSIGLPYCGVKVAVLDEDDQPLPPGERGEICVRGPLVMDGYWNRSEETAAAFKSGWLHTGDVAYADEDGYLFIVDRKKEMIITGGFNVYPREVEDVLAGHPDVAAACVIGVPDDYWGEAVKAVVVPRRGHTIDVDELIALVRQRRGSLHAPKSVDVIDEIPITPVGKPDKNTIRSWYWTGEQRSVH